jgi:hypothetical protein
MEFTPLSNLRCHDVNTAVWVCVVRKWDLRGLSDNGPVQHVDMVLADEQECFLLCSTTPTHKLKPLKATVLVPLWYIFCIPFMLYKKKFYRDLCCF